jgi:hypothetical protein
MIFSNCFKKNINKFKMKIKNSKSDRQMFNEFAILDQKNEVEKTKKMKPIFGPSKKLETNLKLESASAIESTENPPIKDDTNSQKFNQLPSLGQKNELEKVTRMEPPKQNIAKDLSLTTENMFSYNKQVLDIIDKLHAESLSRTKEKSLLNNNIHKNLFLVNRLDDFIERLI